MLVKDCDESVVAIYFAFPKCASEWVRNAYQLFWQNSYESHNWDACPLSYCHVRPSRFVAAHGDDVPLFTIVRNTHSRLASAWLYGKTHNYGYALSFPKFPDFVRAVCEVATRTRKFRDFEMEMNRQVMLRRPLWPQEAAEGSDGAMAWMYMPVDMYFETLLPKITMFVMEEDGTRKLHRALTEDLGARAIDNANPMQHINISKPGVVAELVSHTFTADAELVERVKEAFEYEIDRWGFTPPTLLL